LIKQLPNIPAHNIIIEPEGKNTAACIGLAALHIQSRTSDDVMVVLPSDHAITHTARYLAVIEAAVDAATTRHGLVTIGIKPTDVHTGFGYLEQGRTCQTSRGETVFRVKSIREKPDYATAKEFIKRGTFYWNSGMFIWEVSAILKEIERWLPDLYCGLIKIKKELGSPDEKKIVSKIYKTLAPISIDYGVMEKAKNVLMLIGDFGWSDVGSWDAVWNISKKDHHGNVILPGTRVILKNARNSLVYSPRKLVALEGIKDLIIVETPDALLICKKGRTQEVKHLVDQLEQKSMKNIYNVYGK